MSYERVSAAKLGQHRGRPRVYLQGKWLARGGFSAGLGIELEVQPGRVCVRLSEDGDRVVSGKKGGEIPVIDLNTEKLAEALGTAEALEVRLSDRCIVITPARTERQRRARCKNGKMGALFAGGGFLTQAAKQAGYEPAWAVEWDERYAEIYERNHPTAKMHNCSVSEVDPGDLEPVELMTVPIPCEPFSTKRRGVGRASDSAPPEAHELGDMVFWALRIIDRVNPDKVIVEEVPGFLDSGAGCVLVGALRRMGYDVSHQVVDATEHGSVTRRRRAVVVATTSGAFSWPAVEPRAAKLGDFLDASIGEDDESWFTAETKSWLFDHWARQEAKGNNFSNQKFDAESTTIGAIGKRYFAQQGDGVVVRHPTRAGTYRWLTLGEVKRLHGVPADYWLGDARTTAGEVVGQSVVVPTFEKIIRAMGSS